MSEKTNKILYMALSLLIAVLFWVYVDIREGSTSTQEYKNIPVEFIGETDSLANRGLMLTEGGDTTVDLKLRGPRLVMSNLNTGDIRLQADLSNISNPGQYTRTFEIYYPDNVDRSQISVEYQSLFQVTVQVTAMSTKTIPVTVSVVGEVVEPYVYRAERREIDPIELVISGREEDIDSVEEARVVVDLTGSTTTVEREYEYELLDGDGNVVENSGIRASAKRVNVTVPIFLMKDLKLDLNITDAPGSRLEDVNVEISPVSAITVAGDEASLDGKDTIVLGGEIDLSSYMSDAEFTVPISMPANCDNLSGITEATISIKFKDYLTTKTFALSSSNITTRGVSGNQTASIITSSLDVIVRGRAEDLEDITEDNIRIVADLTEYNDDGTYTVPASVLVDGNDQVGAVGGPYTVTVKLTRGGAAP